MNRDTASKTQYEDSKSHLSNYRKDDKIMLKRKLLSVLLALVLVVSMAVPALAASGSGTDRTTGYTYNYTLNVASTYARSFFNYEISTAAVQTRMTTSLYASSVAFYFSDSDSAYGMGSVTLQMGNSYYDGTTGTTYTCRVTSAAVNNYASGSWVHAINAP